MTTDSKPLVSLELVSQIRLLCSDLDSDTGTHDDKELNELLEKVVTDAIASEREAHHTTQRTLNWRLNKLLARIDMAVAILSKDATLEELQDGAPDVAEMPQTIGTDGLDRLAGFLVSETGHKPRMGEGVVDASMRIVRELVKENVDLRAHKGFPRVEALLCGVHEDQWLENSDSMGCGHCRAEQVAIDELTAVATALRAGAETIVEAAAKMDLDMRASAHVRKVFWEEAAAVIDTRVEKIRITRLVST